MDTTVWLGRLRWGVVAVAVAGAMPLVAAVQDAPAPAAMPASRPAQLNAGDADARAQTSIERANAFLKTAFKPGVGWHGGRAPIGVTALVLRSLSRDAEVRKQKPEHYREGFAVLAAAQKQSGAVGDMLTNYNTAIAITAWAAAEDPAFAPAIERGVGHLKGLQWTGTLRGRDGKEIEIGLDNPLYGGWGYDAKGGRGGPDLSNVQTSLDALHAAGTKADDPALKAALKFVTRVQNNSETNDLKWAGNDGGAIYSVGPDGSGDSGAGTYVDAEGNRRARSYGAMTYAMLKSYIYAGLTRDDPRVKAAWGWIGKNWTLEGHPGHQAVNGKPSTNGVYYYYSTLAKALSVYGEPVIVTPDGARHDWRLELIEKLTALQRPDGSWVGGQEFMESNPPLATAYALEALHEARASLAKNPPK